MEQITARPAATIVVIRNQNHALEILMLRRGAHAPAAPGAHVFPGGGVDAADAEVVRRGLIVGRDAASAARRLDLAEGALTYYCAAVRELFEEAGILFALDPRARGEDFAPAQLERWREELRRGEVTWPDLLEREELRLALGELHYLAHWVTPRSRLRQFDTRFFVARAPVGQHARADDGEVFEHVWTSARDALDHVTLGEWTMLVPTQRTLRQLSAHSTVEDVVRSAATATVRRIQPREVERGGRLVVVVPGEDGEPEDPEDP